MYQTGWVRTLIGMRFVTGVVLGIALAIASPSSAETPPELEPVHPNGTINQVFMPDGCEVVHTVEGEQYRWMARPSIAQVRELRFERLECSTGREARARVLRGPWIPAFSTGPAYGR